MEIQSKENLAFTNTAGNIQKSFTKEQSTQIREIEHNSVTRDLFVEFEGGSKYRYKDVPVEVFQGALDAQSVGSYHVSKIKRSFEYEKLPPGLKTA